MRKKEIALIVDVETAGRNCDETLVYDIGYSVFERRSGKVLEQNSLIISNVFYGLPECMATAYYGSKVPFYNHDIYFGNHTVVTIKEAKKLLAKTIKQYGIKKVYAFNCSFDRNALNATSNFFGLGCFFPYGLEYCDIWHMVCQTICNTNKYRKFTNDNGFVSAAGNVQTGAEVVYRYIINDVDFQEEHTGLEDVKIELSLLQKVLKQKKKVSEVINTTCWKIPQR